MALTEKQTQEKIEQYAPLIQKYDSPISEATRIAQLILESQLFTSDLALKSNNGFGIKVSKPWAGEGIPHLSGEVGGARVSEFRKYPTHEASIKDHAGFFTSTDFRATDAVYGLAIKADNYKDEAMNLGPKFPGDKNSYAGDPKYGPKLIEIIERYNLTQYDTKKESDTVAQKITFKDVVKQVYGTEVINWDGFKGIGAGNRGSNPKGAIIHNDYGRANGKGYISWLTSSRIPNPSAGYAHYYHDRKYAVRAVPTTQGAWHAGDFERGNFTGHGKPANYGNMQTLGYEVNESLSTTNQEFRLNEEVVFMQVAEDALFYGWEINRGTIWLHNEFTSTSCPHRSWELHVGKGKQYNAANRNILKDYFIGRVKFWVEVLSGKRDVPVKHYLPETGQTPPLVTEPEKGTSPHNPQGLKETDLKPYVAPRLPWDKLKAGDTVTLAKNFQWADPDRWVLMQSNKYDELVGKKDVVVEVKQIPAGKQGNHSQTAYKLKNYASWILEEYIEESSASWELVDEKEDDVQPTPPAPSYDGNYVYWDGKKYKVENEIK